MGGNSILIYMIKRIITLFFCSIFAVDFWLVGFISQAVANQGELHIYFFDIGQGDSILVRTPQGNNILIDGGPDNKVIEKLGHYLPFYDRSIDLVVLTHPHADHLSGLIEVLNRFTVKDIITTGIDYNSALNREWNNIIERKHIAVHLITSPELFYFDSQITLGVLRPQTSLIGQSVKNLNNASIVADLKYRAHHILLMGDYENEESLIGTLMAQKIELLKVGHHGADDANDYNFLAAIKPTLAVISSGIGNRYGHPNPATVKNLKKVGSHIFRTDRLGDICFYIKNDQLSLCPYPP